MQIKKYNYIAQYWKKIQSGDIKVSHKVYQTMQMLVDIQAGKDKKYHFDPILANRPIVFIETFCKQSKGKHIGKPLKLELYEKAIIQAIYGVVDKKYKRRFQEALIIMGRKNGKSTLLSGLGNYALLGDKEGGPEIDCVSTKKDAARIVFNEAKNMVKQSPYLSKYIKSRKSDLYCEYNFGVYRPLASDSDTLDGLNPSMVIFDECHNIKDRGLFDVMRQALSAESREQPLFLTITTSGFIRDGIYDELYDYAEQVLNGEVDDEHFISFIYELDSMDEWLKEDCWIKANPGLGTVKSFAKLKQSVERALAQPNYRKTVLTKDFNLKNISAAAWLKWEEIENPETFDMDLLRNTYAIAGADLSQVRDLTCASLLIRRRNDEKIYLLQHYFLPRSRVEELEERNSKEAPYMRWHERGLLTLCDGEMVKYSDVTAWYKQMRDEYQIDIWRGGYDRAMADYWVEEMNQEFGDVMEAVAQGARTWTMPMKEMGAQLAEHNINYNNNPIFKWCLTNTGVKSVGTLESIEPVKLQKRRRIDGTVSALNAYVIYTKYRNDYLNMVG